MSASFVLRRHGRLTISAAFTNVPRVIQRGVNLRPSTYLSGYAPGPHSLRPRLRDDASRRAGVGWVRTATILIVPYAEIPIEFATQP
jgi:hypothetical protein